MLLSDKKLAQQLGVAVSTIHRWTDAIDGFPQPVKIGGATRWRSEDVDAYVAGLPPRNVGAE